jgi:heme exporter protein A
VSGPPPPASFPAAPLVARALTCRRGDRILFRDLELELPAGRVMWLRGSNGRGKTSLLRLLAGLARPEAGSVHCGDERAGSAGFSRQLVYIAHQNALKEDLSAIESLAFLAGLHGQDGERETLAGALRALGLFSRRDALVKTLSQGQRRRVALARLLLAPAKPLWLLDEPYDALDADGSALIDRVLQDHARRGGSVLLTSHLPLALRDPAPLEFMLEGTAA